ncbi:terminase DNA binding subunit 2 [Vombatid gammaherpesvirus 1]|uniref:Terminase DNA binding subunit 2 n=1 Tax=Vombatid gammaherpesvirus 1 TaxID=2052651 RepID=A0A3Q8J4B5_9GAMA|nr:terminase DNA binding subunit 2 [Vombatid gammaherpesvirus 1]AZB49112.1 terminase DNA binding subunit 2 [Vombatid gammaherpesvirus 1]
MSQELALIFAHINGLAMETSLIQYCDPSSLDITTIGENLNKLTRLSTILHPLLKKQHLRRTSPLSLELTHLIQNLSCILEKIYSLIEGGKTREQYFTALHYNDQCPYHFNDTLEFYGPCHVAISLSLINDVETLLKRLNAVFFCTSLTSTLPLLDAVYGFLGLMRGISPIPYPTTYNPNTPCITCSLEATLIPNQGESMLANLIHCTCGHVCTSLQAEPIIGLFENELKQHCSLDIESIRGPKNVEIGYETIDTPEALVHHNIFQKVTPYIIDLSNLIFWNSGIKNPMSSEEGRLCSHLGQLILRESRMLELRQLYYQDHQAPPYPIHFFDSLKADPLESLFSGGIFYSVGDTIDALKKDCSSLFTRHPRYQSLLKQHNELYTRLHSALAGDNAETSTLSGPPDNNPIVDQTRDRHLDPIRVNREHILADARMRKESYLKKVSQDGMEKLNRCIEKQAHTLHDSLTLRLWGSTIYTSLSNIMNHFLNRRLLLESSIYTPGQDDFENCKYIKNILFTHHLSREHISDLTLTFYKLITGPLLKNDDLFPISINNRLAHALDAAGALAHHKIIIKHMIWPNIEPKDWIDLHHNTFYSITTTDLSICQREAMTYIRELVLSVALYNTIWKKQLKIYTPDTQVQNDTTGGIFLTYESSAPLILVCGGTRRIFKDIYTMLYSHLQVQ